MPGSSGDADPPERTLGRPAEHSSPSGVRTWTARQSLSMGRTVTTLPNRPNTALVVLDLQNAVVAEAHERDAVVATVAGLVDRARREDVPVLLFQYSDDQVIRGSGNW